MHKILIVDDDNDVRHALKMILEKGGFAVSEACDGEEAQYFLKETAEKIDLTISDFQMPKMDGIELLKWIKANKPMPVLLVTGFSHILETQQAFNMGADDFFEKPFSYKDVIESVKKHLNTDPQKEEGVVTDVLFCKIPINDFVSSAGAQINIFVKLGDKKFVRVAHMGDQIPRERFESYRAKGVEFLYAKKEDFGKLVGFNVDMAKALVSNTKVTLEKKMQFLRYTTDLVLSNVQVIGIDSDAFKKSTESFSVCMSVITENQSLFEMLDILNNHADWLYAHALGVSIYSMMIGRKLGWENQGTLFKLGTAGLFHDIGEKEIDTSILLKNRAMMSFEERKRLEGHPQRSREILETVSEISDEIRQIVYEHHEDCTGRGYPKQVAKEKIHPLAKILSVADKFCELAVKNPKHEALSARLAIEQMDTGNSHQLDRFAFGALKELCV